MNIFQIILNFFKKKKPAEYINDWHNSALPSPTNYNDLKLGAVQELVPAPDKYWIPYVLRTHDQNQKPICAGETGALIKEEKERREKNFIDFDSEWLYNEAKRIDGIPNVQGTYFRSILSVLKNKGCKPLGGKEEDAVKFKIGGYASANATFDELKSAIYQNGVVAVRFIGSNEGWRSARIRPPKSGELVWGHFVGLVGFDENYIYFQNSFGGNWGNKGIGCFDKNYLPTEAWAILCDLPSDWQTPDKPSHNFNADLQMGDVGEEVVSLQKCLKYDGSFPTQTNATGYFGQITLEAVKKFQQKNNIIPVAGYVGEKTREALNKIFGY